MKNSLVIFLLLSWNCAFSQLNDDFSDGDFTTGTVWSGSNASNDFTIVANQLRSNSIALNTNFYLSTPNTLATTCTWEFWCNLQFATSSTNYVDIYLTSDQANLQTANINGYFVRIGDTKDDICLYKRTGAKANSIKIIDGIDGSVASSTNNLIKIKVTRTAANLFILERDMTGTGSSYFNKGSVTDATITTSSFFGIYIQQSTASFQQKHFFDDFKIDVYVPDTTPPQLLSATAIDGLTVEADFNEAVDNVGATMIANYSVDNGVGSPVSVATTSDPSKYLLTFSNSLNTANYILTANNITDKSGNTVTNTTANFNYVKPYLAIPNDIVINEIFADPSPQIDLPTSEFIELWNTTNIAIPLKNWIYSDGTSTFKFTQQVINANEHVILCAVADVANFQSFGTVIGLSPWPSLNNSGDNLILKNEQGTTINMVNYLDTWYKDAVKKQGGWSLELINPTAICSGIQNWTASIDPSGGTPGKQNSVYNINATTDPLKVLSASVIDSVTLLVTFNHFTNNLSAAQTTNYTLNNGVANPIAALPVSPNFDQDTLKFAPPLARGNNTYTLTVNNVTDCAGTLIADGSNTADFIFPNKITKGDLLINEVLFNPRPNGVDFVEVYNNSANILDLKDLRIATIAKDTLSGVKVITSVQSLIKPTEYRVLTTSPDNIKQEYQTENPNAFLKLASMPSFSDASGTVVLVRGDSLLIDQFNYTSKMHFQLLKDPQGVSLERSSFKRPTNDPGNFRSAAASVGFATPGYKNSQYIDDITSEEQFFLSSKTFSPDNDGFEDELQINYHFDKPGLIANVTVYNDQGVLIRKLVKSTTVTTDGAFNWDGLNEFSERATTGIYIIYADFFDLDGNLKKFKKACVLASKLN